MPSTIGWLAVTITAGSLVGLTIGHWSMVTAWLHRCLEDPVGQPPDAARHADEAQAWLDQRAST